MIVMLKREKKSEVQHLGHLVKTGQTTHHEIWERKEHLLPHKQFHNRFETHGSRST